MARLTIKSVNAAIVAKGIKAEIVKGNGYFWFCGDDVQFATSTSVDAVCAINHLTLEQWMSELDTIVADHKKTVG